LPLARYVNLNKISGRDAFALEAFVKYHISAFRMQKDGQISAVKHSTFGWMPPERYYLLQHLHDFPWGAIVEGGYRLNQAVMGSDGGKVLYGGAVVALLVAIKFGDWEAVLLLIAGLLAPFGAIILIYLLGGLLEGVKTAFEQVGSGLNAAFTQPGSPSALNFFEALGIAANAIQTAGGPKEPFPIP